VTPELPLQLPNDEYNRPEICGYSGLELKIEAIWADIPKLSGTPNVRFHNN